MKNSIVVWVLGAVVLGGAVLVGIERYQSSSTRATVYCTSDGTLSREKVIQSHRSYCFKPAEAGATYVANTPTNYSFSIIDDPRRHRQVRGWLPRSRHIQSVHAIPARWHSLQDGFCSICRPTNAVTGHGHGSRA